MSNLKDVASRVLVIVVIVVATVTAVALVSNVVLDRACRNYGAEHQKDVQWVKNDFMVWGQCMQKTNSGEWIPRDSDAE